MVFRPHCPDPDRDSWWGKRKSAEGWWEENGGSTVCLFPCQGSIRSTLFISKGHGQHRWWRDWAGHKEVLAEPKQVRQDWHAHWTVWLSDCHDRGMPDWFSVAWTAKQAKSTYNPAGKKYKLPKWFPSVHYTGPSQIAVYLTEASQQSVPDIEQHLPSLVPQAMCGDQEGQGKCSGAGQKGMELSNRMDLPACQEEGLLANLCDSSQRRVTACM